MKKCPGQAKQKQIHLPGADYRSGTPQREKKSQIRGSRLRFASPPLESEKILATFADAQPGRKDKCGSPDSARVWEPRCRTFSAIDIHLV